MIGRSPQRIQRQRVKGWRKPEGCRCIGRGGNFGNPFVVAAEGVPDNAAAVQLYRDWLASDDLKARMTRNLAKRDLAGLDLACWCRLDQPCHADVLLEVANGN